MGEQEPKSIADEQRSPASEAADEVEIGPSATNPEDEQRPARSGAASESDEKIGPDGKPIVPPSRGTLH
jgi:hypothetical protein